MYLRSMPDFISSILMLVFWIFIVNMISKFFKNLFGVKKKPETGGTNQQPKSQSTFQDMMKEVLKRMDNPTSEQPVPPVVKTTTRNVLSEKRDSKPQQTLQRHVETGVEKEKRKAAEYQNFIRQERKKEHDAEASKLVNKIYALDYEPENENLEFELDLRNAIIGNIILERPYS